MSLQDIANGIEDDGPRRVMREDGAAVKPHLAGFEPTVIRDDGWSLGANRNTEELARAQWPDKWIGVMRWDDDHGWRLEDYK